MIKITKINKTKYIKLYQKKTNKWNIIFGIIIYIFILCI